MLKYLIKRILMMIPMLLVLIFVTMLMLYFAPQGHVRGFMQTTDQEILNQIFSALHIKDGMFTEYLRFCYNLFIRFDIGTSGRGRYVTPILTTILGQVKYTLWLTVLGLIVTNIASIPLGFIAALHENKWQDKFISVFTVMFCSLPSYCLAVALIFIFAVYLHLLPTVGTFAHWYGYVMPVLTISLNSVAQTTKTVRSTVLKTMDEPYIIALRAKGIKERHVIFRHALKNSLISIIAMQRQTITRIYGSTLFAENFFVIPGIGQYMVDSVVNRNTLGILGCTVCCGVILMSINIICDFICLLVDPKLRNQEVNE